MYTLEKEFLIDCAHSLQDSERLTTKKCLNLHGHTYKIIVELKTLKLIDGMVMDFGEIKDIVSELDHQNLNIFITNPTAENMSKYLYDKILDKICERNPDIIVSVTVYETPTSKVTYTT